MSTNLEIFKVFFKIGLVVIGGGYAMLPILIREVVTNKKWLEEPELMDYYLLGQSLPGIVVVNVASLLGHRQGGFFGALVAIFGVILSPVIIILLIVHLSYDEYLNHIFKGIRVGVVALVIVAIINQMKKHLRNYKQLLIFLMTLVLLNIPPIYGFVFTPSIVVILFIMIAIMQAKRI